MEKYITVKPVEGRICTDPKTLLPIPQEGKVVLHTSYWQRRLEDGDCIIMQESSNDENLQLTAEAPRRGRRKTSNNGEIA
jgi:hypothetical protein